MKWFALILLLFATGCATTAGMNKDLSAAWVGKPADSFFMKYGPPARQFKTQDGGTVYVWTKRDTAIGTPIYCDLKLVSDAKGTLADISVSGSSSGLWTTSYCNEISWQ